ncbi:MAG: phosphoenolpyruvate carboxykinase [Candidatus Omnitrophica bacterium]|nr:phosphoenolpyruvate carboxykinase [Candidatus Omnitrophota bacterium]
MKQPHFEIIGNKIIVRVHEKVCETAGELLYSSLFREILWMAIEELLRRNSHLLNVFPDREVNERTLGKLIKCLAVLARNEDEINQDDRRACVEFLADRNLFNDFVEYIYNFWRKFDRFIVCDSMGRNWDKRPYRTFNATIGQLTNLIRGMYRDIQENITGNHPRIYRQVAAGAEMATISVSHVVPFYDEKYEKFNAVAMIRQVLINPPLILNPSMNKRKGRFIKIEQNPIDFMNEFEPSDWMCYPAKVGTLTILIYFHKYFIELGLSLCNLFQMAEDKDLLDKPDAIYFYGVSEGVLEDLAEFPTVFYEDKKNRLFIGAVPRKDVFGYFGYLKKMVLTLHNSIMMQRGIFPFHGALINIQLKNTKNKTVLLIGDTGAGKSETIEAIREIGHEYIQDMFVIADDMGSIQKNKAGEILGYGTEIGAFLRLDDLKPGYALGQIDRAIIMSANQINARIILPITGYETVIKGYKIDYILYANNYEMIDEDHPIVERVTNRDDALYIYREGTVMSKGTTETTGIVHTYFANIFGPIQYKEQHDELAKKFFQYFFDQDIYVGQIRTRLGLKGYESKGPEEAAKALFQLIKA